MAKMTMAQIDTMAKDKIAEQLGLTTNDEGVQVEAHEFAFPVYLDVDGAQVEKFVIVKLIAKRHEDSGKFLAYDVNERADEYERKVADRKAKADERRAKKAKKIAQDTADRERKKAERRAKKAKREGEGE